MYICKYANSVYKIQFLHVDEILILNKKLYKKQHIFIMKLYKKLFSRWTGVAVLATMGLFACQPEIEVPTPTSGSADFSTYVALGNSLTSGYSDGALYREGQVNSYPSMLAMSMDAVGGIDGEFKTPLVPAGNGSGGSSGRVVLTGFTPTGTPILEPQPNDPSVFASVASAGPYQNLGVPGAKSFHLVAPGYGSSQGNPFFARFASSAGATVVADAAAQSPTFFTLWIGNNDVLGYALAGGDQGNDPITPRANFEGAIRGIIAGMDAAGAKGGAIANIPDILSIPFFTAAAFNAFPLEADQATALNAGLRASITAGVRPLVIAGVRAEVRKQVVAGATATIIRPQVLAAIRDTVTAQVRAGAVAQGVAGGLSQQQAEAQADGYVASEAGQADIQTRYDAFILTDTGKATIQAGIDEALARPSTQALIESQTDQQLQTDAVQATIEQNVTAQVNGVITGLDLEVQEGRNNRFIIQGAPTTANPTGLRRSNENDLILLTASTYLGREAAAGRPPLLPESLVLDPSEQAKITAAIAEYNAVIQAEAGSKYAYVNMNSFFNQVKGGYLNQGVNYDARFILGGAFSLDGVHLTQRGYALAANEFIKSINSKYNSKLPWVDANSYKGITFP